MSKPVPGDEKIDETGRQLARIISKTVTEEFCRNLDLSTAKSLMKAFGHAKVELDDCVITKMRQSQSGIASGMKRKSRGLSRFDLPL